MGEGSSELGGFVFAVVFILMFSAFLSSMPAGLQGPNEELDTLIGIDPSIITGFADYENFTAASFYAVAGVYWYEYDNLGNRDWLAVTDDETAIQLAAKIKVFDIFWFGSIDICEFGDRGTGLSFTEIDADAEDGVARYPLTFTDVGESAGTFVVYWNITNYASVTDAWDNDEVYLLHGVGFDTLATNNIAALLLSLLFLQIPEVPPLLGLVLAAPTWACVIFILWYIIKEMIPFVG